MTRQPPPQENSSMTQQAPPHAGHYRCIVIDPPWDQGKTSTRAVRPKQGRDLEYATMTLAEIEEIKVPDWASKNAFMWLWATNGRSRSSGQPILQQAFNLMSKWGFRYYTILTWDKGNGVCPFGPYQITTEHCLFGYRGKFDTPRESMGRSKTLFSEPSKRHSQKPSVLYERIREHFPSPRLDVFARRPHPGVKGGDIMDHQEMAETQKAISQRIDREAYKRALSAKPEITGQTEEEEIQEREREWDSWDKKENPHLSHALSTEFATGMTDIAAKAGGIWSDPLAVKRMAGGPHGHWDGKMKKASPMAGRMLSGEKVYLMHYFFAGTTAPQPGYARLIWDDRQADQLTGISFNKRDSERFESPLDSSDCDDQLSLVFMYGPGGQPKVLILKLPMSIDGGVILNINQEDQRKLKDLGYHFYQQVGAHRFPNLHDTSEEGIPLFPDVLQPREIPEKDKPRWTTKESEAAMSLLYMNRFAHVTGMVTNLSTALYYSRLWDPLTCKCNYSEGVIDRVANGDADPSAIAEALTAILYYHVANHHPVDSCVAGRVRNMLNGYHQKVHGQEAAPLVITETCNHRPRYAALEEDTKWLGKQLSRRELAANGPKEWFQETFAPEVVEIMIEAKRERNAAWSERFSADRELSRQIEEEFVNEYGEVEVFYRPAYRTHERNVLEALNVGRARMRERSAMETAKTRLAALKDYRQGAAHAVWNILCLQGKMGKKSRYDARSMRPLSTYALTALPDEEQLAFNLRGQATPTIPLRPTQGQETLEPGRNLIMTKMKNGQWWLIEPDTLEPVIRVKTDARHHADHSLRITTVCYLPSLEAEPDITTGESILMVELTPRS